MKKQKTEKATFAMGCFWTPELIFSKISGVLKTEVGFMGGSLKNPSYKEVCTDTTGHAEVVQITFSPDKVSYSDLLNIFWKNHDPTQVNRQGPDIGAQYRSEIFYHSKEQKKEAEISKKEMQKLIKGKIVTEIAQAGEFYKAEEYHQSYLKKRGLTSCHINV